MSFLSDRLLRIAGAPKPPPAVDLSAWDLTTYVWKRGGRAWLRGLWWRPRFRQCGARLLVGRGTRILFPRYISAGRHVLLDDFVYVNGLSREGVRLGDHVHVREHGWIQATSRFDDPGRGVSIGEGTYVGPHCYFGAGGGIQIGRGVLIGAHVHLLAEDHEYRDPDRPIQGQGVTRRGITIEDGVWIGNSAIVLDGVTVGQGAVVGAGAVVARDVPPLTVVAGNPARAVARRGGVASHPAATG